MLKRREAFGHSKVLLLVKVFFLLFFFLSLIFVCLFCSPAFQNPVSPPTQRQVFTVEEKNVRGPPNVVSNELKSALTMCNGLS